MDLLKGWRRRHFARINLGGNSVSIPERVWVVLPQQQHSTISPSPRLKSIADVGKKGESKNLCHYSLLNKKPLTS